MALDVAAADDARQSVRRLGNAVSTFKVGKQLFTAAVSEFVRELAAGGRQVFLDLKFHDIPNTVAAAVQATAALPAAAARAILREMAEASAKALRSVHGHRVRMHPGILVRRFTKTTRVRDKPILQ